MLYVTVIIAYFRMPSTIFSKFYLPMQPRIFILLVMAREKSSDIL